MTASPFSETPSKLPRFTFQTSSASRPVVAASPFMMHPPVKTSAVWASTYEPVLDAPRAPCFPFVGPAAGEDFGGSALEIRAVDRRAAGEKRHADRGPQHRRQ